MATPLPVLAVTGLAREARLAAGPGVVAIGAGGDPERLRRLLAARVPPGCRAVVSLGIAGGLDPALRPGDVVVASGVLAASDVLAGDARRAADLRVAALYAERLAGLGRRVVVADLAGVDAAVLTVEGKRALREATGAAAVDMESHVAAAFAAAHGLPFAALRAVCDPAERALPPFVATALKPDGEPDVAAVLGALLRGRVGLGALLRLARDSGAAFASLGRARALLGPGLGLPDL